MYIATFYSFKGGVGRTLAMVNVGVELAQTGRRVLLVDFDLEAPGLHTFDALQPKEPQPGVLEFVHDYLRTHAAQNVADYVYDAVGIGKRGGQLLVMPSGQCDNSYQQKLSRLDWQDLYRNHEGYLLFEDLKAQWERDLKPDYVLIDSRTGHTDVQGICTRQLPDAVVILFFPNRQNLDGLEGVVSSIRAETESSRREAIKLHFVMSNVPDLDDEEEILKKRRGEFREKLGFRSPSTIIYRYDSLALLNQSIFTRERPKSRLAKEYRVLSDALVQGNLEDREGARQYLDRVFHGRRRIMRSHREGNRTENCQTIVEKHADDSELLFMVGLVVRDEGSTEEALLRFDQAVRKGNAPDALSSSLYLERGDTRRRVGDTGGAKADILRALQLPYSSEFEIHRAVRLLRQIDEKALDRVTTSPMIPHLPFEERMQVVGELKWSRFGLLAAQEILKAMLADDEVTVRLQQRAQNELALVYVGLGLWDEALSLLERLNAASTEPKIQCAFNFAMADWGKSGTPTRDLFARVVELEATKGYAQKGANYEQCLSVAHCLGGDLEAASARLARAKDIISDHQFSEFTCWRYLHVSPDDFLQDCESIEKLIAGESLGPRFMESTMA